MTEYFLKGKQLEHAVEAIERAILETSPMYNEDTFRMESPKIIVVDGVKHEIDVWVEVEIAKGYNPVFIFECKNRQEKTDKNDIIVFSEKIDASRAQHGFFVSRSFTRDAKAQAEKDSRITLLPVTELPVEQIPTPFDFHHVVQEGAPFAALDVLVLPTGAELAEDIEFDFDTGRFVLRGQQISFREYLAAWVSAAIDERNLTFPSGHLAEDVYDLEASQQRTFADGELLIDGHPISSIDLRVEFKMRVVQPPLISAFEVSTRGRSLSMGTAHLGHGIEAQVTFVSPDP